MHSPKLPWKVIEQITDLSAGRSDTLCNLTLMCCNLHHPSHLMMFSQVQLKSHDCVFVFITFLLTNPELQPFVHTITITPATLGPSLLYIFPNLLSIECIDELQLGELKDEDKGKVDLEEDETPHIPSHMPSQGWQAGTGVCIQCPSVIMYCASLVCFR